MTAVFFAMDDSMNQFQPIEIISEIIYSNLRHCRTSRVPVKEPVSSLQYPPQWFNLLSTFVNVFFVPTSTKLHDDYQIYLEELYFKLTPFVNRHHIYKSSSRPPREISLSRTLRVISSLPPPRAILSSRPPCAILPSRPPCAILSSRPPRAILSPTHLPLCVCVLPALPPQLEIISWNESLP